MSLSVVPAFTLTDYRFELHQALQRSQVVHALHERAGGAAPPPRPSGPLHRLRERLSRAGAPPLVEVVADPVLVSDAVPAGLEGMMDG